MLKGMARLRQRSNYNGTKYISFSFDSRDTPWCSIPGMIASILVQAVSSNFTGTVNKEFHVLQDLFLLR